MDIRLPMLLLVLFSFTDLNARELLENGDTVIFGIGKKYTYPSSDLDGSRGIGHIYGPTAGTVVGITTSGDYKIRWESPRYPRYPREYTELIIPSDELDKATSSNHYFFFKVGNFLFKVQGRQAFVANYVGESGIVYLKIPGRQEELVPIEPHRVELSIKDSIEGKIAIEKPGAIDERIVGTTNFGKVHAVFTDHSVEVLVGKEKVIYDRQDLNFEIPSQEPLTDKGTTVVHQGKKAIVIANFNGALLIKSGNSVLLVTRKSLEPYHPNGISERVGFACAKLISNLGSPKRRWRALGNTAILEN